MSVELDPPELGFKREKRQHAFPCTRTERGRPLPTRGVADAPSQEPSLGPGRIQGEQMQISAHCCVMQDGSICAGRTLTTAGQNHRSQAVRLRPTSPVLAHPLMANTLDTACGRTAGASSLAKMSKSRVRHPHASTPRESRSRLTHTQSCSRP